MPNILQCLILSLYLPQKNGENLDTFAVLQFGSGQKCFPNRVSFGVRQSKWENGNRRSKVNFKRSKKVPFLTVFPPQVDRESSWHASTGLVVNSKLTLSTASTNKL